MRLFHQAEGRVGLSASTNVGKELLVGRGVGLLVGFIVG